MVNDMYDDLSERLEFLYSDLIDNGYKTRYKRRLETIMEKGFYDSTIAKYIITNPYYIKIKGIFIIQDKWNHKLQDYEVELLLK